jgi:hypothetical protein
MPDDFVFTYKGKSWSESRISGTWKEAAVKAHLPHISNFIGVKHASASEIATETGDIFNISKMLGHRGGIKNTMKYTERIEIKKFRTLQPDQRITLIRNATAIICSPLIQQPKKA